MYALFSLNSEENAGFSHKKVKIHLKTTKSGSSWCKGCHHQANPWIFPGSTSDGDYTRGAQEPAAPAAPGSLVSVQNICLTLT